MKKSLAIAALLSLFVAACGDKAQTEQAVSNAASEVKAAASEAQGALSASAPQ